MQNSMYYLASSAWWWTHW